MNPSKLVLAFNLALLLISGISLRAENIIPDGADNFGQGSPFQGQALLPEIAPTTVQNQAPMDVRPTDPSLVLETDEDLSAPLPATNSLAQSQIQEKKANEEFQTITTNPALAPAAPPLPNLENTTSAALPKPPIPTTNLPDAAKDDDLSKPDPDEELSAPLTLPSLAPMAAGLGNLEIPKNIEAAKEKNAQPTLPVKTKSSKNLPLVLAPSFFGHPKYTPKSIPEPPKETFTQVKPPPPSVALPIINGVSDVSIILSGNEFYPSKVLLKDGIQVRLIFTTTNKKPAALVIEQLQVQRWVAKEDEPTAKSELDRSKFELTRELNFSRITELVFDAKTGSYNFHDVMSGASGEILVEK